jgi:hypothetical protein
MARAEFRISGYRVEELLGAGSSGEVWRARVNATGVAVALKRIWLSDPAQRRAALSEAAMLSTLDHPHLMKLHEVRHVDDDAIVLVLDLAAGGSLASLLARRGRLTVGETITTIAPIGAALAYAHHNGVVHGDVSSANILFTDIGLPLLADLGVARLLGDTHPVRTTPAYADPAVASGALPGPASDVFMLGAVALHLLTGSPAWPGSDPVEVFEAAATGEQPDFAARMDRAGIPEPVRAVVARALSVEPAYRGTTADFALDLRHAADPVAVELSAGRPRVAVSTAGRVESWPLESVPVAEMHLGSTGPGPAFVGEQPLTYGVRAPSPFAMPAGRHLARSRPRITAGFGVCAVLLAVLALSAVWWWPFGGTSHPRAESSSVARVGVVATPTASVSPAPTPAADARLDARRTRRVLAALDATRSRAFASRNPAMLASVYASHALLARDRAQLLAIVPSGCGLHGVHTRFGQVAVVSRSQSGAQVQVAAAVAPSHLVCDGTRSGRAPGTGVVTLRMTLVRHDGRYLIAAETNRH